MASVARHLSVKIGRPDEEAKEESLGGEERVGIKIELICCHICKVVV